MPVPCPHTPGFTCPVCENGAPRVGVVTDPTRTVVYDIAGERDGTWVRFQRDLSLEEAQQAVEGYIAVNRSVTWHLIRRCTTVSEDFVDDLLPPAPARPAARKAPRQRARREPVRTEGDPAIPTAPTPGRVARPARRSTDTPRDTTTGADGILSLFEQ